MSSSLPSPLKICLKLAQSFKDCCGRRGLRADRSLRKTAKKNHPSLSPSPLWQSNTSRRGVDTAVPARKGFGQRSVCYRGRRCSETRSGRRNPCSIGPASVNICPEFAQRQLRGQRGRLYVPTRSRSGDSGRHKGCASPPNAAVPYPRQGRMGAGGSMREKPGVTPKPRPAWPHETLHAHLVHQHPKQKQESRWCFKRRKPC